MDIKSIELQLQQQLDSLIQQVTVTKERLKRAKEYSKTPNLPQQYPYEFKVLRDLRLDCKYKSTKLSQKGIEVCQRWIESFNAFLIDMGCASHDKATIVRLNSKGNFTPDNCIWK